jgi:acid phosphatase type 7
MSARRYLEKMGSVHYWRGVSMLRVGLLVGVAIFSCALVVLGSSVSDQVRAAGDPVLVGAGDIASCSRQGDEATAKLLDNISGTVYTLGDNAYPEGTDSQFRDCYGHSWGRHKARTRPSIGNHEYYGPEGAQPYYDYFGTSAGPRGKGYYSYERGSWHIVVLNSMCSKVSCAAGSAQQTWLKADLAAHPNKCTLAYFHYPRFSSGGNYTEVAPFWKALYEARAEVVLSGHVHAYERFAPQNPSGVADSAKGIREFIVGTGGKGVQRLNFLKPTSQVRNTTTLGVLKLILHSSGYEWKFVPIAGKTFTDSGTNMCH